MDTRSKSSKILSVLAALLVVTVLTAGAFSFYPFIFERAEQKIEGIGADDNFQRQIAQDLWKTIYELKRGDSSKTPIEIFAPEYHDETLRLERMYQQALAGDPVEYKVMHTERVHSDVASYETSMIQEGDPYFYNNSEFVTVYGEQRPSDGPEPSAEPAREQDGTDTAAVGIVPKVLLNDDALKQLGGRLALRKEWEQLFNSMFSGEIWMDANLDYWVKDYIKGSETTSAEDVKDLFEHPEQLEKYQFAAKIKSNAQGRFTVTEWYNRNDRNAANRGYFEENFNNIYLRATPSHWTSDNPYLFEIDRLQASNLWDMEMVIAVPLEMRGFDGIFYNQEYQMMWELYNSGLALVFWVALGLAAACGLCFGLVKKWRFGEGRVLRFLPAEGLVLMDIAICICAQFLAEMAVVWASPIQMRQIELDWMLPEGTAALGFGVLHALCWAGLLLAVYLSFLSFAKIFTMGLWPWICERCWTVKILRGICHGVRYCWRKATEQQIEGSAHKMVIGFVLFNGAAIILMCCGWFFAIPVALIYSCVLYYLLKKKYAKTHEDYQKVLDVAQKMANGDLAAPDDTDAGVYEPLKNQLCQVREGFQKAVDAEVKSQSMKTELITNVSHDLKTPLTAIITYVDLLKKPDITDEERADYIETLDKKSQRLKQLIADLFDVSKAVSREMTPDLAPLDLAALLNQVRCELGEELDKSGITFRWNIPEQKVPVRLDGARTCRIFENLLVNITKYALKGTRAYVSLETNGQMAIAAFKNVSAAELPEDAEAFTERFVRGDASRSTEGSGLGLAIAKSFTEIQGGKLELLVDGDLFTARLTFPLDQEPPTREEIPEIEQPVSAETAIDTENLL